MISCWKLCASKVLREVFMLGGEMQEPRDFLHHHAGENFSAVILSSRNAGSVAEPGGRDKGRKCGVVPAISGSSIRDRVPQRGGASV